MSGSRCLSTFAFVLLLCSVQTDAQRGQGGQATAQPAKNLLVLTPDANIPRVMASFNTALGVQCAYCHTSGDFASDANPKKEIARNMLRMLTQVASRFPDSCSAQQRQRRIGFLTYAA